MKHTGSSPLLAPVTWLRLFGSWSIVGLFTVFGSQWLGDSLNGTTATLAFLVLFITILAASFGVVREADHLAHQLGEPYGTLILTLSIVLIEVILIASVLLGPGDFPTIGRDSIYAVMMIILNLITGLCLIAGAARNGDQAFNRQGTRTYLSMIVLLTSMALILPNYTRTAGEFSTTQAIGISILTGLIYALFLSLQMGSRRHDYMQPHDTVPGAKNATPPPRDPQATRAMLIRSLVLIALILPIVLLAHDLAIVTDYGIAASGAPVAVGGVLIAIIVFTPESITAIKAAMNNEMQRAINLCLGAFVSTVGLTVPVVLLIGLISGKQVVMGISNTDMVLFLLTVMLSMLSFGGPRTSPIHGYMHLMVFAVFGLLLFYP
ncbi:calcium:proton antiporter [Alcaligenes ammonioxydans]|jgi:Ca2+:H+ antiporter|uniref:calcium:proton antiporter n=1 Tax=Alcaligenes TaxID=507 RepID=UPI0007503C48|nr:calcium:proton antiporter [Alcaligenes ammonioxydans]MCH1879145.1 calcium:proton antiporter [Alcaligenes ammonioxydans]HRK84122.1 calcium:proton antiporter [Alcaligenes faecalis]